MIATRGRPDWLEKQLAALAPQLRSDERIVVVIDGEPDNYPEIEGPVEVVRLARNLGPDRAKRLGIALVPSEAVVCEIDDHDVAEPELLQELRAAFRDPAVLVAYCDVFHSDPEGKVRKLRVKKGGRFCETGNLGWGMRAYRKWAYDAAGGYPEGRFPANDYELLCRMEQLAGPGHVLHIRKPLVTVTQHRDGASGQNKDLQQTMVEAIAQLGLDRAFDGMVFDSLDAPVLEAPILAGKPTGEGKMVTDRSIPKLLHFVWVGPPMPEWARYNLERWRALNSGWPCLVHDETVLLEEFRPGYESIEGEHEWGRKADLLRVSALCKFGGWYFDIDFLPFRPMQHVLDDHDGVKEGFFLVRWDEGLIANGVMGAALNSAFLRHLRDRVRRFASMPGDRGWGSYGPKLITTLAAEHPGLVQIGDPGGFFPYREREEAWGRYREITEENCSPEVIDKVFEHGKVPIPYMLHMSMQDALTLEPEGVAT